MSVDAVEEIIAEGVAQLRVAIDAGAPARLARYARLVARWRKVANLTTAATPEQFAREHIIDSLAVLPFVHGPRVLDVGSGAGVPGLVVALARPELAVTLLEPRARRARFLTQVRIDLTMERLDVVCDRAQAHEPSAPYDEIIARALGSFADFVTSTRRLHSPGTRLLAMKARFEAGETRRSGLEANQVRVEHLRVPGFRERCLVIVDFAGSPSRPSKAGEGD